METQSRQDLKSQLYNITNPIPRVDISSLTPETFAQKYQKTGTPVVITGLLNDECDWNLDYLCEKFGNQTFVFRNNGTERYNQDKRKWKNIGSGVAPHKMPFTEYADMLRNHTAHEQNITLRTCPLKNTPLADTDSLQVIGERLGLYKSTGDLNIFVSPGGHNSVLHYDAMDGTLMQMHGAKKVILFPPSQTYNLYPFPAYTHLKNGLKIRCWFSQVYPENPDYISFPKLKYALQHKREVILNQGETLYIPAGWWHEIIALGDEMVCSVNRFWKVYPTSRALLSWSRWRALLGIIFALPYRVLEYCRYALPSKISVRKESS
jgi:lysine-specific demethylase 8/hypoxia-inducible factor 1-alpha inhibitor (HIF hydroxylase)